MEVMQKFKEHVRSSFRPKKIKIQKFVILNMNDQVIFETGKQEVRDLVYDQLRMKGVVVFMATLIEKKERK